MINLHSKPRRTLKGPHGSINSFLDRDPNISAATVESFGDEWNRFGTFEDNELDSIGADYFHLLPSALTSGDSLALDVGCGSGRWTKLIAPKFKFIEAVDPSSAVFVAQNNCSKLSNVRVSQASVANLPFAPESFDLVFSLGVLHHVPDTGAGILSCVRMVKPGGYFLVYLYYSLDNRGIIFNILFHLINCLRRAVSKLPQVPKHMICDLIAILVYMPLSKLACLVESVAGPRNAERLPLNYYRDKSFYIMRNDSRDRFGTPLEQRFSKSQIQSMLVNAGLTDIKFSERQPFWVALGRKPAGPPPFHE